MGMSRIFQRGNRLTAADLNLMRRRDHQARTRIVSSRARSITTIDGQVMLQPAGGGGTPLKWCFVTAIEAPRAGFPNGRVTVKEATRIASGGWVASATALQVHPAPGYTFEHYRYFVLGSRSIPPITPVPLQPHPVDSACMLIGDVVLPDFRMLLIPPSAIASACETSASEGVS
jgi:hypothetical protein